jgi:hypothetical protein
MVKGLAPFINVYKDSLGLNKKIDKKPKKIKKS